MPRIRLALCQINTTVGALDANVDLALDAYARAEAAGADLALFPEMTITGYPAEDLLLKPGFVADNLVAVDRFASATGHCAAFVGFADGAPPAVYNAAAVCVGGERAATYHKRELPTYGVFDEKRLFLAGHDPHTLYDLAGVRVGLSICEDLWVAGGPVTQLGVGGAQLVVNINGSPYHRRKLVERERVLADRVAEAGCPIAYLNLVGGQDELVFDGGSMVVDDRGRVVARARQFVEDLVIVDLDVPERSLDETSYPVDVLGDRTSGVDTEPAPDAPIVLVSGGDAPGLDDPLAELHDALVLATRDYLAKTGFSKVCLGLSGGIDSSLVAALGVAAVGPEQVHGVLMPSRYSSDHSVTDAEKLAANLGITTTTVPIETAHAAFLDLLAPSFAGRDPDVTEENLQSRIRGVLLMALANKFGWLVLTTGNKSEAAVGYSTLYGDTAGAYAVIKDVYKLDVYRLAEHVNERAGREVIARSIITKPPSAELRPDQRDDQSLPPYDQLDPLLEAYIEGDRTATELIAAGYDEAMVRRITRLVDINEYKRRQTPLGPRVTTKGFGRDRRLPIVNGYRG